MPATRSRLVARIGAFACLACCVFAVFDALFKGAGFDRFAVAFLPVSRWVEAAAGLVTLALVAWAFALPDIPEENEPRSDAFNGYVAALLLQWTLLSLFVAVRFWRSGAAQPTVVRYRVRLLALATIALAVVLILAGFQSNPSALFELISALLTLASALLFFVGFGVKDLTAKHNFAQDNGEYGITCFDCRGVAYYYNRSTGSGEAGYYIGDSKNAEMLKSLPLNTRNLYQFLALTPGVLGAGGGQATRRFAGSRVNQSEQSIDGITVSNGYDGTQISPLVSYIGSFEEVRVDLANNTADIGAVGQVTVISKSGTNDLHGLAVDYYSTPWFRARNPFALARGTGVSHNFGGQVGGPVVLPHLYDGRNRSFFFASFETT